MEALKPFAGRMKSAPLNETIILTSNVSFIRTKDGFVINRSIRDILPVPSYHSLASTGYPIYSYSDCLSITLARKDCVAFNPDFGVLSIMQGRGSTPLFASDKHGQNDEQLAKPKVVTDQKTIIDVFNSLTSGLKL